MSINYGGIVQESRNYELYQSSSLRKKFQPAPRPQPAPLRSSFREEEVIRRKPRNYGDFVRNTNNYSLYESGHLHEKVKEKKLVEVPACQCHQCPNCGGKIREETNTLRSGAPQRFRAQRPQMLRRSGSFDPQERKVNSFQTKNRVVQAYEYGELNRCPLHGH